MIEIVIEHDLPSLHYSLLEFLAQNSSYQTPRPPPCCLR
jgi:hypothetical protein